MRKEMSLPVQFGKQSDDLRGGEKRQLELNHMECPACGCKETRPEMSKDNKYILCPECGTSLKNVDESFVTQEIEGMICGNCGEKVGFVPSHRRMKGNFYIYSCDCGNKLTCETPEGDRLSLAQILSSEWLLTRNSVQPNQKYKENEYLVKPVENQRRAIGRVFVLHLSTIELHRSK